MVPQMMTSGINHMGFLANKAAQFYVMLRAEGMEGERGRRKMGRNVRSERPYSKRDCR